MKKYLYLIIAVVALSSCKKQREYFPRDLDLNSEKVEILRYDSALLSLMSRQIETKDIAGLFNLSADFTTFYAENIIGIPSADTLSFAEALTEFLSDTVYGFKDTNLRAKTMFANTDTLQTELNAAFSRLKYLYPTLPTPEITFFISGFNASLLFWKELTNSYIMPDSTCRIAIGVDMYLDSDWPFYNRVVYNYQKNNMRKECIPIDVVTAYLFRNFGFESKKSRLIDNMIYRGKIMYLTSVLFPKTEDYEIMGYTKDQMQWCKRNEKYIWRMMMDKHDLFKTETLVLTSYLNDGPFTSEISQEAPARLGTWIGWQIAKSYMENNPQVSLEQLISNNDAQQILENSNYRP